MDLAQELRADEGEVVKVADQQRRLGWPCWIPYKGCGCIAARKMKRWMMRSLAASSRRPENRRTLHSDDYDDSSVSSMERATALEV